jgi:hypothetical protein
MELLDGVRGDADFIENGIYRPWLIRQWNPIQECLPPYALWIGMNPSKASAYQDDPTIRKEQQFTRMMGLTKYVKCNVMDYVATDPRDLRMAAVPVCSDENLQVIQHYVQKASKIILAYGNIHHNFRRHVAAVHSLFKPQHELWCLGITKSGNPTHPLYLPYSTKLMRFH